MTALYVPPTDESDHKKQNQSIQNIAGITSTNTTNISTNTTNIATNTTNITALQSPNYGIVNSGGSLGVSLSTITVSLGSDVVLNSTLSYFDGPSIAQGVTGTWWVSGTVTIQDSGTGQYDCKLWDGTTVVDSARGNVGVATASTSVSLSGFIASPAANLKISVKPNVTTGTMKFNVTGNSKDSTISAFRIA